MPYSRFLCDRRGNIAMMFGLLLVPLVAATGAAIDFSRAYQQRMVVQDALDAAALAANRLIGTAGEQQIRAEAQAFFAANVAGRLDEVPTLAMALDSSQGSITLTTALAVPTSFLGIIGINDISFDLLSRTVTGGRDLEVALVLDITGSMAGSKIADLRDAAIDLVRMVVLDEQTPHYTKVALAPYSMGVNAGAYIEDVRGDVVEGRSISGIAWQNGSSRTIAAITRANPARVTTSSNHGLQTGDVVYISGISGGSGMRNLNGNAYRITRVNNTRFTLDGVNSSNWGNWTAGGTIRECLVASCELVVTSAGHGLSDGDYTYLTGLSGSLGNQLNNEVYAVGDATANSYVLAGLDGPDFANYSSGGISHCVTVGCDYYRFMNARSPSQPTTLPVSSCTSERLGPSAYTDDAPDESGLGWNYASNDNPCPGSTIVPLTSNRNLLTSRIGGYQASGSTAGQIGIAWGWYLLSPNFASLYPAESRPAPYDSEDLLKVAVIMTDGEFNTGYCNHTVSRESSANVTPTAYRSNCYATNGDPADQAERLCEAMKRAGIVIYTVGFDLREDRALEVLENCASSSEHFYVADDGDDLQLAFQAIGTEISRLRIAE